MSHWISASKSPGNTYFLYAHGSEGSGGLLEQHFLYEDTRPHMRTHTYTHIYTQM